MKAVFSRIAEGIADRGLDHANSVKKKPTELDAESIWCNSNDSGLLVVMERSVRPRPMSRMAEG
ncbi:hypothetical protein F2Q69_00016076 [Brassica cretica]|uniref:Uncharacterized protein n=1 Tax=Brassica cretica TaxID=69181 RepID=A0A8S9R9D5_BRACR|nr:hypothetical protein F2Q69_00016076 [Brassica cretica]